MNKKSHIIYNIIIVILILIMSFNWGREKDIIYIPPEKGQFTRDSIVTRDSIILKDTVIYKDREIIIPAGTNRELLSKYEKATDSIEMLNLYISSIQHRKYTEDFEDKNAKITITASTIGTLESLGVKYSLKEREVEIKRAPIVIRAGVDLDVLNFRPMPKLSVEDRRGYNYTATFGKDNIIIGTEIPIFKIK